MPALSFLPRLLPVLTLLLLGHLGWGQALPHYSPPSTPISPFPMNGLNMGNTENPYYREGAGSYQTAEGEWHRAEKMRFDGNRLVVKDGSTSKLALGELRCLEIARDSFLILKTLPGRAAAAQKPEALQVAYSYHGTRLLCLYYQGKVLNFLQRPGRSLQLLPTGKDEFKTTMLAVVQSCPAVAAQVADGTLGRHDALQIVQAYDACR
jgi:hypothetical protein